MSADISHDLLSDPRHWSLVPQARATFEREADMDFDSDDESRPLSPPTLWPEDERLVLDFDPFKMHIPGNSLSAKVRYLLSRGIIYDIPGGRTPGRNMQLIALKCLYAAMVGFKKENLTLLYPSGKMGTRMEDLLLSTAQQVAEGPSVRDRCCGHVFEKGETYYRCKYAVNLVSANLGNAVRIIPWSSVRIVSIRKTTEIIQS
jgi:hypothetical protein